MIKKIETMVSGLGQMSIDALATWFPKLTKEDLIIEINKSDKIELIENVVCTKANKIKDNSGQLVNKSIDIIIEGNDKSAAKKKDLGKSDKKNIALNMSINEIEKLISNYNKSVENKLKVINAESFKNKELAIERYYSERFKVEKIAKPAHISGNLYSLEHKTKEVIVAYLYISDGLEQEEVNAMATQYKYDTVYFCPVGESNNVVMPIAEFYLKETKGIIDKYKGKAQIKKKTIELFEIV